jgi:Tol biopolymer transport system component
MHTMRLVRWVGVAAALCCATPVAAQHRVRLTNSERPVAAVPFHAGRSTAIVLSPDGRRGAYVMPATGGFRVVLDGKDQPAYEQLARGSPVFSPDGKRLVYAGAREGRWYVIDNDEESQPFDAVLGTSLLFGGPAGGDQHLAYVAARDKKQFVVLEGIEGPPCDAIDPGSLVFSPDGNHLAYVGRRKQGAALAAVVVVDGVNESLFYEWATPPTFSADSMHFAYVAARGGTTFVVLDNREEPAHAGAVGTSLRLRPDGRRFAYVARADGGRVVVDSAAAGAAPERYEWIFDGSLAFSPDGSRLAYVAKRDGACVVVVDGEPGPGYDGVAAGSIAFSPDCRRVAYVAERGDAARGAVRRFVVVDGNPGAGFDRIRGAPRFSPNGRRVAYVAERLREDGAAQQFVVVDGAEGKAYACIRGEPVFSPDSTRVAVMALEQDRRFAAGEELAWTGDAGANGGKRVVLDATEYTDTFRRLRRDQRLLRAAADGTHTPGEDPLADPVKVLVVEERIEDE